MTDEERKLFREQGTVPPGWRWCPDCDGEGVVWTMDPTPSMPEHSHVCGMCKVEGGIVPLGVNDYRSALHEIRSALGSIAFAAPEMLHLHLGRIDHALAQVGIQ